jgi:RimJ/RimL family protein N-acetyltransferase
MEKAGMRREGISKKALPLEEGWVDTYEYAILEEEYLDNKSKE